jgi:hypothetical protein
MATPSRPVFGHSAGRALATHDGRRIVIDPGLGALRQNLGETFTVEGQTRTFVGLIEETRHSNEVGEGGFLPMQNGILTVERSEFEAASMKPWLGMRVTVNGRVHLVSEISTNPYRWVLSLIVAHPKADSDVPAFTPIIEGETGTPLGTDSNNPFIPTP